MSQVPRVALCTPLAFAVPRLHRTPDFSASLRALIPSATLERISSFSTRTLTIPLQSTSKHCLTFYSVSLIISTKSQYRYCMILDKTRRDHWRDHHLKCGKCQRAMFVVVCFVVLDVLIFSEGQIREGHRVRWWLRQDWPQAQ